MTAVFQTRSVLRREPSLRRWKPLVLLALVAVLSLGTAIYGHAYSVLSHEAIVDAVWSTHIVPLLKKRFPNATPDEIRQAHAFAYGGSIIQDMGYYPYGSKFFSDLAHYVRSGDFIAAMLRDACDINEYAFAIGAMSHYAADNDGHRLAVNRAVPLLYPDLRKKYGDDITYEDDPIAHVKTEFGFDVLEVARGRYAPDAYRDFIGFEVAQPPLERAFKDTYGLELPAVLEHEQKAIASYRHDVSVLIPRATRVAWQVKKNDIQQDVHGITRRQFLYNMSRASYEKRWGNDYRKPGFREKVLAFLFRVIPKIGPLRVLTFRTPTPQTEKLFEASFNTTLDRYRAQVSALGDGTLQLSNDNFDVGKATSRGEYRLSDATYARLLHQLSEQNFSGLRSELQTDIERFYAQGIPAQRQKQDPKQALETERELSRLKAVSLPEKPTVNSDGETARQ